MKLRDWKHDRERKKDLFRKTGRQTEIEGGEQRKQEGKDIKRLSKKVYKREREREREGEINLYNKKIYTGRSRNFFRKKE